MAGFGEALTGLVLGDAGLSALVGDRVHWVQLPPGVTGAPYLIMQGVGDATLYTLAGDSGLQDTRIQFDAFAESQMQIWAIERAMRALFVSKTVAGGVEFQGVFFVSRRDTASIKIADSQTLRRSVTDYRFRWKMAD